MPQLIDQVILALIAAIPAFILGLLTYKGTVERDKAAARAVERAEIAADRAELESIKDALIESLQEEGQVQRVKVRECAEKLEQMIKERDQALEYVRVLTKAE